MNVKLGILLLVGGESREASCAPEQPPERGSFRRLLRQWSQETWGTQGGRLTAWVLGRARPGQAVGGEEGEGRVPTCWGVPGQTMRPLEIVLDPTPPPPCFPACPLCGLDPGGCVGAGRGALNGPLVSALGVGQVPGHTAPSPALAQLLRSLHPSCQPELCSVWAAGREKCPI